MIDIKLFTSDMLSNYFMAKNKKMVQYVQNIPMSHILESSDKDLVDSLIKQYVISTPVLMETEIKIDAVETMVTIRANDFHYDNEREFEKKGIEVTVMVPFKGDAYLFIYRPSTYSLSGTPTASIESKKIILSYKTLEKDPEKIKKTWQSDVSQIKKYLEWVEKDVSVYMSSLKNEIEGLIQSRKREARESKSIIDSIKQ